MKAIGIDLGTTNSVVAVYEKGTARTVDIYGHKTTPSVVSWNPDNGKMSVGHPAKKRVLIDPKTSIVSNKRFMGNRDMVYEVLDRTYTPMDIASFILKHLVDGAFETLGEKIVKAVVTVPAYFNQNQKEDTKLAAEKAGLEVLMLQAEPTAAAIAYGFNQEKDQTIMVYDLGGGTFDVSILEVSGNNFTVKAISGDAFLGGDNFDETILEYLYKEILSEFGVDLFQDQGLEARKARQQLKELTEQAKIELASARKTEIILPSFMGMGSFECELTRNEMKKLIMPHLLRTIQIIRDTLRDANLSSDDINRVVRVGGSTKSPLVSEIIAEEIKSPYRAENVDEIVAKGAAITAINLLSPVGEDKSYPVQLSATNVTPFSLGIRLEKDKFGILIPKNSQLPITTEREFTTTQDHATETEVVVFQGSNEICSNNIQLGGFALKGIQKARAGIPRIQVRFNLNESDILEIEARDLSTQKAEQLKIERFIPEPYEPEKKVSLDKIKIGVSRIGCDDMGAVLGKMGFRWTLIKDGNFSKYQKIRNYTIVFINCNAGGSASANRKSLNEFVRNGGVLYVSDLSAPQITEAFPGKINFGAGGIPQKVTAKITSDELARALNKDNVKIHFDLPFWIPVKSVSDDVDVYMKADVLIYGEVPIMVGFDYGEGHVVYTAFHNHSLPSEDETELLKIIALKPISVATKTPLAELAKGKWG